MMSVLRRTRLTATLAILLGGHAVAGNDSDNTALLEKARQIHSRILAFDSHVDIPLNYGQPGLKGASIAVFVPQGARNDQAYSKARTDADKEYRRIRSFAEKNPERAALAYSPADVRRIAADGKFAIVLSLLNAYPLVTPRASITPRNELGERDIPAFQSDLNQIDEWYNRGVRILGFVHAGHNDWADSSRPNVGLGDAAEEHCGLSELGKNAVRRLNDLGVLIDVSQLSTHALEQVLSLTKAPVAAVQGLMDTPRNVSERELDLIKKSGGVVQIASLQVVDAAPKATLAQFVDAIDYAVKRIGVDHVGISLIGWENEGASVNVTTELLRRSYGESDIAKLWGGNFLRVWQAAQDGATHLESRR